MTGKTFLGIVASVALLYVGYRAFGGNRLLGSFNSGQPGTQKVTEPETANDEIKLKLFGILSDLEAKFYGIISSDQAKEFIQKQIDDTISKLKQLA